MRDSDKKQRGLMGYKTYNELIAEHIKFLHSHGLDVETFEIDAGFVRCRAIDCTKGRGELSYKATSTRMGNGLIGLATWCRGIIGVVNFHNYGLNQTEGKQPPIVEMSRVLERNYIPCEKHEIAARKAYGFWKHSQLIGVSDYLDRKEVGFYGLRFRNSDEYGRVAVVPMVDENGRLWNYQLLNSNGTKRYPKDARTERLFHCLAPLVNGYAFGIAESYVTAATCYELTGIPTVCAFSCHNLVPVAKALRLKYSDSHITLFADNDQHLTSNQGLLKAQEACNAINGCKALAAPFFLNCEVSKSTSDWNDLVRLKGKEVARNQLISLASNPLENNQELLPKQ